MNFRTDLALENKEYIEKELLDGVISEEETHEGLNITRIKIINEKGQKLLDKPLGDYITIEHPTLLYNDKELIINVLISEFKNLMPKDGLILLAGLGNKRIASDSLGYKCISKIAPTRRIDTLSPDPCCCAIKLDIFEHTGIEAFEIISSLTKSLKPKALIVIDSLAARNINRIGSVIQISTGGISPGSGVGIHRREINKNSLNIPVISIGMPTIVDAKTFIDNIASNCNAASESNLETMFLTLKNIDLISDLASELISSALNSILQNKINITDL